MKKDTHTTQVIFLIERPHVDEKESVFAYFKNIREGFVSKRCYSHIGQHSTCSPEYAKDCKFATPEQYKDLAAELESIGYNLEILTNL